MIKRSKTEARLQNELKNSFDILFPDEWWYKIPDTPYMPESKLRFIPKKPFDIIISVNRISFAIETKVQKSSQAFPMSAIHEHQEQALLKADGYLWINIRHGLGKARTNYIISISIADYMELKAKIIKSGRKSIPLKDFETYARIEWVSKQWDMREFFREQIIYLYNRSNNN